VGGLGPGLSLRALAIRFASGGALRATRSPAPPPFWIGSTGRWPSASLLEAPSGQPGAQPLHDLPSLCTGTVLRGVHPESQIGRTFAVPIRPLGDPAMRSPASIRPFLLLTLLLQLVLMGCGSDSGSGPDPDPDPGTDPDPTPLSHEWPENAVDLPPADSAALDSVGGRYQALRLSQDAAAARTNLVSELNGSWPEISGGRITGDRSTLEITFSDGIRAVVLTDEVFQAPEPSSFHPAGSVSRPGQRFGPEGGQFGIRVERGKREKRTRSVTV